jgi:two-component system chemotaxis sensor kinase CheA
MDDSLHDPALLREFIAEAEESLQAMDQDLIRLEQAPSDQELLNRVFRAMHSVKGTAGFFGLEPIVRLGHQAEDVLTHLRKGKLQLNRQIMDALLAARDLLGHMLADLRGGALREYPLERVVSLLEAAQSDPPAERDSPAASSATKVDQAVGKSIPSTEPGEPPAKPEHQASMRVQVQKLDELVDLIGELVLERNRLLQVVKESTIGQRSACGGDSPLCRSVERLSAVTEELQSAALRTRMVSMQSVFSRFPRLVRDLARSLDKQVELVIRGEETEIDKTLVELISDPLVHLVRNSLDHGLESPGERAAAHKPPQGTICLGAQQQSDHILVTVSDDGRGIDPARVLQKAIEKGLVSQERAASLSKKDILEFIFAPGFSTAQKATDLSGRGVGMDVVRCNLSKMNGTVIVESEPGKGTTIELSLPLTMAILPVLLVQVAGELYALPLRSVVETGRFVPSGVHQMEEGEVICLRNQTLPLIRLARAFSSVGEQAAGEQKILVLNAGSGRVAVLVDRLVGQESTVIKPLTSDLTQRAGLIGASVGSNGDVRLVIDPSSLLASGRRPQVEARL